MSFLKGWISNQYRTEEERDEWTQIKHNWNAEDDDRTEKILKKLNIDFTWKTTHSFQLNLGYKKVMLFTGKNGYMIYDQKNKNKQYFEPEKIEKELTDLKKQREIEE